MGFRKLECQHELHIPDRGRGEADRLDLVQSGTYMCHHFWRPSGVLLLLLRLVLGSLGSRFLIVPIARLPSFLGSPGCRRFVRLALLGVRAFALPFAGLFCWQDCTPKGLIELLSLGESVDDSL